jgi:hypothetical protein
MARDSKGVHKVTNPEIGNTLLEATEIIKDHTFRPTQKFGE